MVEIFADFVTQEPCRNFSNFYLIRGVLQWWSMRKHFEAYTIIAQLYIIFLIDLGIPLIFTDFQ